MKSKKKNKDYEIRVERHLIQSDNEIFLFLDDLSFRSKNVYNYANYIARQIYVYTSRMSEGIELDQTQIDFINWINEKVKGYNQERNKHLTPFDKRHKRITYNFFEYLIKDHDVYKELYSSSTQQTIMQVSRDWISHKEILADYKKNPEKYKGRPSLPRYKEKNGRAKVTFTNQSCKIKDGKMFFPKQYHSISINTNVTEPLQEVRIIPFYDRYIVEIVYKKKKAEIGKEIKRVIGIDLGVNNFVTMANNTGLQPIVVKGEMIKSKNQLYNKEKAHYQGMLEKINHKKTSKRLNQMSLKRYFRLKDYTHKTSVFVINYCVENNIDTIIIGKNNNWKQNVNMGRRNNQNFVNIPYNPLIEQITYKANDRGIQVIVTEESYTSKASFLDSDVIPVYEKGSGKHQFSGRRIHRGLYRSKDKILINADVNSAYNIIIKVVPNALVVDGIAGIGLYPVKCSLF